jgi:hypothetical protein
VSQREEPREIAGSEGPPISARTIGAVVVALAVSGVFTFFVTRTLTLQLFALAVSLHPVAGMTTAIGASAAGAAIGTAISKGVCDSLFKTYSAKSVFGAFLPLTVVLAGLGVFRWDRDALNAFIDIVKWAATAVAAYYVFWRADERRLGR